MYCTLAGSLNIINGYSGQMSLGHAGFFCVGAYTAAILSTRFGVSFWLVLPLAGIFAAIVGMIVAIPTLRMKGIYLSIITLGASEVIRIIALNWQSLTGGSFGIQMPAQNALYIKFTSLAEEVLMPSDFAASSFSRIDIQLRPMREWMTRPLTNRNTIARARKI